jgi:hypothetical protein
MVVNEKPRLAMNDSECPLFESRLREKVIQIGVFGNQ